MSVALLIRKDVLDGVSTSTHCAYTLLYGGETLGIFYIVFLGSGGIHIHGRGCGLGGVTVQKGLEKFPPPWISMSGGDIFAFTKSAAAPQYTCQKQLAFTRLKSFFFLQDLLYDGPVDGDGDLRDQLRVRGW